MFNIIMGALTGLLLLSGVISPFNTYADSTQLVLNYDGFFDRMDDLDEPEYQDIKLAFYFMDVKGNACPVKAVRLQTQLAKKEVYHLASGEILLPFDHQLDADKAAIVIDKVDSQPCGLDMRLETSILFEQKVGVEKAKSLIGTFDLALNDLAGMMSFTLPDVVGITFKSKIGETLTITNLAAGHCELNACTLTLSDLTLYQETIKFSHTIMKAVPYIK
ncbi:DUF2987 domain-containing protein [Psychrosphaera aquimarina]|uniref:DUF2987 domain-containing protein n=1 Tax=Psychrosphaera aquimarina TaxID=2044854 RepID=A0ABU3QWH5_9GAMM|nr:DUF2987 domain-containing protein [Psychrosphaera aquimarina]MDU0111644.1 DUF2987 domain-containing protein [Psychrosphaera aquimarina]